LCQPAPFALSLCLYQHCASLLRLLFILTLQDARDFGVDGYTLRLQRMDRKIKLFICVTLYNEDYDELRKTLVGICDVSHINVDTAAAGLLDGGRAYTCYVDCVCSW
jgi:hypothetical protein